MVSPAYDRRQGLTGNVAMKTPCKVVSTTNITLSGEQTIDGVAVLAVNAAGIPDRVLVAGQTSGIDNGIYDVSTAGWTRAVDANATYDLRRGSQVAVNQGTVNNGYWKLTTADPIVIGTTSLTWTRLLNAPDDLTTASLAAADSAVEAAGYAAAAAASVASAQQLQSLFNRIYLGGY